MANRGRGGGKQSVFKERGLDVSQLKSTSDGPPPLFPPMENLPIPMPPSQMETEIVEYQKSLANWFKKSSPFYLQKNVVKNDLERYSDRYKVPVNTQDGEEKLAEFIDRMISTKYFPEELFGKAKGKLKDNAQNLKKKDLLAHIDQMAANVMRNGGANGKDTKTNDDEEGELVEEEIEYDEEAEEEENDYINSYFDNGENEESDGEDVGAVY